MLSCHFCLNNKCFHSFFWKKHQPTNLSRNVVESTRYVVDSTTFPEMWSNRRELCRVEKCGRILEKCCRVDEISGNVVGSTRNVVESTTFCFLLGKREKLSNRQEMLASRLSFRNCRIDEKCCRVDVIFNFHGKKYKVVNVVESTTFSMFHRKRKDLSNRREMLSSRRNLRKCCRAGEKCCRVDDISNFHRKRKRVVDPTTFPEMLSNRREMLSSGRHGEWC